MTVEWQPIETAPKDWQWLLLCIAGSDKAHIGIWAGDDDGWQKDGEGLPLRPTHWMPLPEPPQ